MHAVVWKVWEFSQQDRVKTARAFVVMVVPDVGLLEAVVPAAVVLR